MEKRIRRKRSMGSTVASDVSPLCVGPALLERHAPPTRASPRPPTWCDPISSARPSPCARAPLASAKCPRHAPRKRRYTFTDHVTSSSGQTFIASGALRTAAAAAIDRAYWPALLYSASYDLFCPRESVQVRSAMGPHFIADGCGQRVIYECPSSPIRDSAARHLESDCQMIFVNRFALQRGSSPRAEGLPGAE
jgi:hypothetical protein